MSLAQFLQVGMALRERAGIDTLERGLKLPAQSKSQEQLRNYAMQALRRTQQRLLLQVGVQGVNLANQVIKTEQAYISGSTATAPRSYIVNDRRFSFAIRGTF